MATPRKHWFRVADSVLEETWTNDELAAVVRLLAAMNTQWARNGLDANQACKIRLGPSKVEQISGRRRRDVAVKSLERLANLTGMSVERDGNVLEIVWPKYAEMQELRPGPGAKASPRMPRPQTPPPPPPQDADAKGEREPLTLESPAPKPARKSRKAPARTLHEFPLDEEARDEIAALAWQRCKPDGFTLVEVLAMVDECRDASETKGHTAKSWPATVHVWLKRNRKNGVRQNGANK